MHRAIPSGAVRVLSVGNLYPPHDQGGGYEAVWHGADAALRAHGHTVRVLTTDYLVPGREDPAGADVHRELRWYWEDHAFPKRSPRALAALERHNAAALRRQLADFAPDVVGFWSMGGMSLSALEIVRRAGVPAVAFVHDDWLLYGRNVDAWHARLRGRPALARAAERLTGVPGSVRFAAAAHYAFVSRATRDRARASGVPLPSTSIAHSGIDPSFVDPAPPREWGWRLLYVGRIDRRKGIETAVRALAALPGEATLDVAGEGGDEDVASVREAAREAGVADRVQLLGGKPPAEVFALYAGADVVVFPVEWQEPWGLVPLEAMARGRPVVATGRGGSSEYLCDGENALLFPAGDAEALAERLRRLAGDPALRDRLRERGLETAAANTAAGLDAAVEAALEAARHVSAETPGAAARPPSLTVVRDRDEWQRAEADVLLFADPDLSLTDEAIQAHRDAHARHPDPLVAVQGAIDWGDVKVTPFMAWLGATTFPPRFAPEQGELGIAALDLRHVSVKRALLEEAGGPGSGPLASLDLAYRLGERPTRLLAGPTARLGRPVGEDEAAARLPALLAAEREFLAEHPHVESFLAQRIEDAARMPPLRGRAARRSSYAARRADAYWLQRLNGASARRSP